MKKVASIFSWIGGILSIASGWISFTTNEMFKKMLWMIPILIFFTIANFLILIWRENSVKKGKKVACGIVCILTCAVLGGILTLCIPEKELYNPYLYTSKKPTSKYTFKYYKKPSEDDKNSTESESIENAEH